MEIPGVYKSITDYIKKLQQDTKFSNILQGNFWKNKYSRSDGFLVLPVVPFFDDFERLNALGSHCGQQKLGGVYVSLPFLSSHLVATKSNVFINSIYSKDRIFCGNKATFSAIINDLDDLSKNGLEICVDEKKITIYFECVFVDGDNLGLNSCCGFNESFNVDYWCRLCRATGDQCQFLTEEVPDLIRNRSNYELDLRNNSGGVRSECIFNKINKFHIAENQIVDIGHDLFEGTANEVIAKTLTIFIFVLKLFSLDDINKIIDEFDYSDLENSNKPRPLRTETTTKAEENFFGSTKIKLKQLASQKLCLSRYLGLMIADLIPDKNNKHWKLIKILRKIIGIVTSPRIVEAEIFELEELIQNHHELYIELFENLKPKAHLMTHIPRLMREYGPLIHFWTMPFERKHTDLKVVVNSRRHLPTTIALRDQLSLCYRKECTKESSNLSYGPKENEIIPRSTKTKLQADYGVTGEVNSLKRVVYNGKTYKNGTVFLLRINDDGNAVFCKLYGIYQSNNKIIFHIRTLPSSDEEIFNADYYAYKVEDNNVPDDFISLDKVPLVAPSLYVKKEEGYFVAPRHDF